MKLQTFLLNYAALFLLMGLTADALIANWNFNPIWDIFYARIGYQNQSLIFYNSHAASILSVCAAGFWLWLKHKDPLPVAVFAAFGTASIHEIALDAADLGFFHIPSGISWSYGSVMAAILVIGWSLNTSYHKKVWLSITVMMTLWFLILGSLNYTGLYHIGSTISATKDFAPSNDFYNPQTNFFEVVSWLAPVSLWFLPREIFTRKSRSSSPL